MYLGLRYVHLQNGVQKSIKKNTVEFSTITGNLETQMFCSPGPGSWKAN